MVTQSVCLFHFHVWAQTSIVFLSCLHRIKLTQIWVIFIFWRQPNRSLAWYSSGISPCNRRLYVFLTWLGYKTWCSGGLPTCESGPRHVPSRQISWHQETKFNSYLDPTTHPGPWAHIYIEREQAKGIFLFFFLQHNSNSNSLLKVNSLQQVGKTTWQFCELGKIPPSLGKYAKSSITWHHVYHNCQLVLPTCWRLNFVILAKILGCQVLLPSPNSELLNKASFFTWHLVLRLGKTKFANWVLANYCSYSDIYTLALALECVCRRLWWLSYVEPCSPYSMALRPWSSM
jgi:hypothetical protein